MLPIITDLGFWAIVVIGSSVVVENVFGLPGLGPFGSMFHVFLVLSVSNMTTRHANPPWGPDWMLMVDVTANHTADFSRFSGTGERGPPPRPRTANPPRR